MNSENDSRSRRGKKTTPAKNWYLIKNTHAKYLKSIYEKISSKNNLNKKVQNMNDVSITRAHQSNEKVPPANKITEILS